jgi:hypothetical protein
VTQDRISLDGNRQSLGLTKAELRAVYRLVFKKPLPAPEEAVPVSEAVLVLAAGILGGYGFDSATVLTVMARLWAWLEDDSQQALMLNVVDRRYVGWHCVDQSILVDMTTGEEVSQDQAIPGILESVAYNLYELVRRRTAMARGERASLWEGRDAASHTARGEEAEGGLGLGEPRVLRDDAGASVPR